MVPNITPITNGKEDGKRNGNWDYIEVICVVFCKLSKAGLKLEGQHCGLVAQSLVKLKGLWLRNMFTRGPKRCCALLRDNS